MLLRHHLNFSNPCFMRRLNAFPAFRSECARTVAKARDKPLSTGIVNDQCFIPSASHMRSGGCALSKALPGSRFSKSVVASKPWGALGLPWSWGAVHGLRWHCAVRLSTVGGPQLGTAPSARKRKGYSPLRTGETRFCLLSRPQSRDPPRCPLPSIECPRLFEFRRHHGAKGRNKV